MRGSRLDFMKRKEANLRVGGKGEQRHEGGENEEKE